jgi:hypothetical protein
MADIISQKLVVNFSNGPDYLAKVGVLAQEAKEARDTAVDAAEVAKDYANSAANSANTANNSALSASSSADNALLYAQNAQDSANAAQAFATSAQASADSAADSAQQANSQAQSVGTLVQEAENIVAALDAYSVPTWDASTVYSYPAVVAYTDGNTYRCIGTNVPAGTQPDLSQQWVRISVLGGDDYFDIDLYGSLMPALNPTYAYNWQLDSAGNIMPRAVGDELNSPVTTTAEQAMATAEAALARANTIIYQGIPVELDSAGNVTTTEDTL